MSQFLYLVPTLTILVGALVLMFMSMYDKFNIKNHIFASSVFLIIALLFALSNVNNSFSVQPYESFLFAELILKLYFSSFCPTNWQVIKNC